MEAFASGGPLPGQGTGLEETADSGPDGPDEEGGAAADRLGMAAAAGDEDSSAPLNVQLVREGFARVTSPGRMEVVRRSPVVIVDSAHNPAGMAASMEALTEAFSFAAVIGVLAVSEDKDVPGILDQLEPVISELVVTRNSADRSMDPDKLAELAGSVFGAERVHTAERLDDALEIAVGLADEAAGPEGLTRAGVLVTGSVITAGDARVLLIGGAGGPEGAGELE